MSDRPPVTRIDVSVPHPARTWCYWAGGKDHFRADRRVGDEILAVLPRMAALARADRRFLARVVRFLAGQAGVRQFLEVGVGLPDEGPVHRVAQEVDPSCRVVYVDVDPVVLAHARALLVGSPAGAVDHLRIDLADPEMVLLGAGATLDFAEPVAVLLLGVVEFLADHARAYAVVERLVRALPPGGFLVLAHLASGVGAPGSAARVGAVELGMAGEGPVEAQVAEATRIWNASGASPVTPRTPEAIGRFFTGLEVLDPGVVPVDRWRPDPGTEWAAEDLPFLGGVGRKP